MKVKNAIQSTEMNTDLKSKMTKLAYKNGYIELFPDGWYLVEHNAQDQLKYKEFICCHSLSVLARCHDENDNWFFVLQWEDYCGNEKRWLMPAEHLHQYSLQYIQELSKRGLKVSTIKKPKDALSFLINKNPIEKIGAYTSRLGWHGKKFVTPYKIYGDTNHETYFQDLSALKKSYSAKGSIDDWRNKLSSLLREQSRFVFAISSALSGSLLKLLDIPGGGFHIVGKSSIGKSICLYIAASVWGNPRTYINHWNTTSNAAEALAAMRNDGLLVLDEISQAANKDVGTMCYMLANDKGKSRSFSDGGNRPTTEWRIIFLSNGEETLKSVIEADGGTTNAGMEVRLCHIDADPGKGFGIFDSLVLGLSAEEQANTIRDAASMNYGTAGDAWLTYLTTNLDEVKMRAKEIMREFKNHFPEVKSQANRACDRFSILAAAGEIATEAGITGWETGDAMKGVKECFENWIMNNGHDGNQEERNIVKQLSLYLEKYANNKFEKIISSKISKKTDSENSIEDDSTSISKVAGGRSGYYRESDQVFLIPPNTFEEICKPYSLKVVIETLVKHKLIKADKDGHGTLKINNPNVDYNRAYAVKKSIMDYQF